jgi:membrane protein DedA with SNARE-associated domain
MIPTSLAAFLDLIRQHSDIAYTIAFGYASANLLLMTLFAGYAAYAGVFDVGTLIVICTIGTFLGDAARFAIGRWLGTGWLASFPRLDRAARTVARLAERHHVWMILLHRYPNWIRTAAGFAYGMSQVRWSVFLALNAVASVLWACATVSAGYAFGHISESLVSDASSIVGLVMLAMFLGLSVILVRKLDRIVERQ